ncbi:hypothetical protein LWI29_033330 [Acer saccharum]|uniref:Enhancer of polycomb-like protein n=1 Tax=Acer saccharum TaxID=4024 RepID=A0AA39RFT7_ACESA|nr:hypothetical protein LWI29_033330 [Acer saccharum]
MENRIGNSDGAEIPKKSRSLDLKSLYKSKDSMASHNNKELKRKNSSGDGDEKSNKKKKSSKTVSISSLKNVDNSKGAVEEVYNGHLSSGLHDKKDKKLGLNHNWDNGSGFSGISLSLDDGGIQIPKRKRDFVGRKKVEVSKVLKPQGQSCSRVGSVDKVAKVTGNDSAPRVESPKNLATQVESSKDLVTQVKSSKDSGRQVESSKDTGRLVESSKNSVRQVESSKDTGRQVESSKDTGRQVESSKDSGRQVESSKDTGRQVESSKDTGRQVESSKDLGRQVQSSKDLGRQVESSKVKRKKGFESFKENRNGESNSARNLTKEGACASHLIVNHGESSVKKETINSESKSNRHLKGDGGHASNLVTINGDSSQKKSNRISSSNLAQDLKEDDRQASHLVVNNSDSSLKKSRRKNSKRKDSSRDRRSNAKEAEPSIETSVKVCDDLLEDEKNLEENAAMMLSSRFDPSCTGFSSNGKSIASKNGLSFMLSSGRDLHSHGSESASFDAAGRALRPRMEQKERGQSRKRRHYYEVSFGDLDAFWVLNRRIKVFWPLDQCWYYGLVNDYDKERKLHHVKYDDRDEEWINLENERFKLLLLPSDVPGKTARRRSRIKEKFSDEGKESLEPSKEMENRNLNTEDDKCMGSYMDSEPIISWLARSTRRIKSSPFHAMKKQKTSDPSLDSEPSLLFDEAVKAHGCLDGGYSERNTNKLSSQSELTDRFTNGRGAEDSVSGSPTRSYDGKRPIVYYRRRLRKTRSMFCVSSPSYSISSATPTYVTVLDPLFDGFGDVVEHDISQKRLNLDETLWSIDNAELFKLTIPWIESRQVRFELSYPVLSVLNYAFEAENLWLVRAVFLLHHGTLTTTGPRVHLEMLFVDNVSGLRFLLFEGCLKQVVAHVFLVLTVFRQTDEQGKYADLQLPVTSIRFKFSCIQDLRKQLVFAFYNFAEVKNSMWMYLDSKLKRRCLLDRQLPLSKCTFDNIKALQNGSNQSVATFLCGDDGSTKGLPRRSRPGISLTDVLTKSTCGKASQFSSNSDKKHRKFSPFAISFAAAPTFFLSLHLKLLMEHSGARSFRGLDLSERPDSPSSLTADDCSRLEHCLDKGSESNPENIMSKSILGNTMKDTLMDAASDGCLSVANSELSAVGLSAHSNGHWVRSPQKMKNADVNVAGTSTSSRDPEEIRSEGIQKWQGHDRKVEHALSPRPPVDKDKMDTGPRSPLNGIRVEIPTYYQFEKHADREFHSAQRSTDLSWNMNGGVIPSPNPTAPRSTWHRNRSSLSFGHLSHRWSDGKTDIGHSSFGTGPKKPRTQVSYSLPFGGFDYSSKNRGHNQKGVHHTRIRRPNEKRFSDVSRGSQKNLELSCNANVLITLGDKGRRECGAQIVLELFDHHEWKLAVKVSGMTRYSYKAHQFMQLGSTNRHTHAMMWKGGKDWTLEFPDRSQWALFKEMHEECYNRNVRAASVKNIPIPGVRLIEETDDYGAELAFVRCSSRYFRQVETDVEMGLNTSRILYDMDSDDEQWILKNCNSSEADNKGFCEISEEMFEKTMDMFEKAAYSQQREQFTSDDIEELMAGVGSIEAIKTIHEYWRQKRKKKGMPLIRHLQPPLWERYQQQVREWEIAMSKINTTFPNGYQEKVAPVEKPAMSAFCLKPRGLEVPNKGSKQRSHRRISVSGQSHIGMGDHDGFHTFGRRLNGFAFGDEKVVYPGHNYESLDDSPLSQTSPRMFSPRVFSPRDAGSMDYFSMSSDGFDRNQYQKHQRSKSKRMFDFPYDSQMAASCNQRLMVRRNGIHRWNMDYSDWPSQRPLYSDGSLKHGPEQFDGSDLDEFRLRDASGAAQHARNIAKLKREKAQRLLYRADLAVHKAVAALMTAEAIKASYDDDVNSDE